MRILKFILSKLVNVKKLILFIFLALFIINSYSQVGPCDSLVPSYIVNLSGNPDSAWSEPDVDRDGSCCSYNHPPNNCVTFVLTLDEGAQGIIFDVTVGAVPNNLEWQLMNSTQDVCDTTKYPGKVPVCLNGLGPHYVVFCKPGGNGNTYHITSVPKPSASSDIIVNDGCSGTIQAFGYDTTTIQWNSVYPGTLGQYNNYLSCDTVCTTSIVTGQTGMPQYVDYQVCGMPIGGCDSILVCDTVRAYFNPTLFVNIAPDEPTVCFGGTEATLTANGVGGYPPYTYLWSTAETSQSIDVGIGTYMVTIYDSSTCPPNYDTITVTAFSLPIEAIAGNNQIVCSNNFPVQLNGSVIAASGGTWFGGNGTFLPSPNSLIATYSPTAAELLAGSVELYLITTGNGSCPADTDTLNLTLFEFQAAITNSTDVSCYGGNDGTATASALSGTSPFLYSWSGGGGNASVANTLTTGIYTVTVSDSNGCFDTPSVTITQPTEITATSSSTNTNCGDNLGTAIINPSGGTPSYSFLWSDVAAQTTQTATGLFAGSFNVTVTDSNNCAVVFSIYVDDQGPPDVFVTDSVMVSCYGGNDGSATATITLPGLSPHTFLWNDPSNQTDSIAMDLQAGTYTVVVTDANGCTGSDQIVITQPDSLYVSIISSNITCSGYNDGTATANVTGGISPYSYSWSNLSNSQNINSLSQGTYSVTVTDSNLCQAVSSIIITNPLPLIANISGFENPNCNGFSDGSATVSAQEGTSPYTYLWSNGQTSQTSVNLANGTYQVTVSDVNNCQAATSVTITEPVILNITASLSDVSCNGGSDGAIDITVSGGTTPYLYGWSNGFSSEDISGISAGNYAVTISDFNNCIVSQSFTITEPAILSLIFTQTNVLCLGENNGAINITASGGTSPYSYNWSNSSTSEDISGLIAGNYIVTVTDANGCIANTSATITEPSSALTVVVSNQVNVSCFGGNNATIDITASGGTNPYTYLWSSGSTSEDLSGLSIGTYTVTVTDANGCQANTSATITQPAFALSVVIASQTNVLCYGNSTGEINITASGGTTPYSYNWSDGTTTEDLTGLVAGTYSVTITDNLGCSATVSATITQPASALAVVITSQTNVLCFGENNGAINITASGGTTVYLYNWSNSSTSEDLSGLIAGTYIVTVTDANGCMANTSATITEPSSALTVVVSSQVDVSCFGGNNGAIYITASGGTNPYTYLWSSGSTSENLSGLSIGTYTVMVTDANSCQANTSATITQPAFALSAVITSQTNVLCYGNSTGEIALTVSGGTTPYSYNWSNGSTTEGLTGLVTGTYTVTVTDYLSCTATVSATITQPVSALTVVLTSQTNVLCFGGNNGTINITASGGTTPYLYNWSNSSTSEDLSGLIADTYTVTVTDANGCIANTSATITEPLSALAVVVSNQVNVSCFGGNNGAIYITASGGTNPYTYLWSSGSSSEDLSGLSIGTYTVTVTDNNGCTASVSTTITQPAFALSVVISSQTNVLCYGNSTGEINITASGGTTPYSYNWSDGTTTEDLTGLVAGTYSITVTDNLGCTATVSATITQPSSALTVVLTSQTNVLCFDGNNGAINITASGGTTPYSYNWSNGSTSENLSGLIAGTYIVTVTDANGCIANTSATITEPSSALTVVVSSQVNVSCFGGNNGTIDITAGGGTSTYAYLWSSGSSSEDLSGLSIGTYTVTVTDANSCQANTSATITQPAFALSAVIASQTNVLCYGNSTGEINITASGGTTPYSYNWSNGSPTEDLTGLVAGTYSLTVTDNLGCSATVSATITQPASALAVVITSQINVLCFGGNNGAINITASGGTTAYSYNWSNSSISENLSGLIAGTYIVTVTDANGCMANTSATITEPLSALAVVVSNQVNVSCFGGNNGAINITASGGTSPYTYLWSSGSTSEDLSGLSIGTYTVTVSDNNGCTASVSATITQPAFALSVVIASQTNVLCYGNSTGEINITASGGTTPYSYNWSNGSTTEDLTGLVAGTYTVIVTDYLSCTATASATITQPVSALAVVITSQTNVLCFGGNNGAINITASGGTTAYSYNWSNGSTSENLSGLIAGNYIVTVTDANGCMANTSATITEPLSALTIVVTSQDNVSCFGGNNGAIDITAGGGTSPYTYLWSSGSNLADLSGLSIGTYTVTVTDSNSCTASVSATITQPSQLALSSTQQEVSCNGLSNGSIDISVTGGTSPYTYLWTPAGTNEDLTDIIAGTYLITITDANNCSINQSFTITEPTILTISLSKTDVSCFNGSDGTANASSSGGTAPYSYQWDSNAGNQQNATANSLLAGTYSVTVTDSKQCVISGNITVNQPLQVMVNVSMPDTIICPGNSATISANASGGTGLYTYAWDNGLGSGQSKPVSPQITTTYKVTATDSNGCTSSPSSTTVYVNGLYPDSLEVLSTGNICLGETTSVYAVYKGNLGPYLYEWDNNLGNTPGPYSVSPQQTTTYTITVTNACSGISISDSIVVEVFPYPIINISGQYASGCEPLQVTFEDTTLIPSQYSFLWNFGDGTTSSLASPTHIFKNPGIQNVTLSVSNLFGCQSNSSGEITVEVYPNPKPAISAIPLITSIKTPNIEFNIDSITYVSAAWNLGDNDSTDLFSFTHAYADTGKYTVSLSVTNTYGCVNSNTVTVIILPFYDFTIPNAFSPDPNNQGTGAYDIKAPNNDIFYPYIDYVKYFKFEIFNRWGELIFVSEDYKIGWNGYYHGKLCEQDVYIWRVEALFFNEQHIVRTGDVTLLR